MAIVIGKVVAIDCGMGISAPSTSNLQVGSLETTRCGTAVHLRDDVDNKDLRDLFDEVRNLLNRIEGLKLSNENEESLRSETITLIQTQLLSPSPSLGTEFRLSLRSIIEGATGSSLYETVTAWANNLNF